MGNIFEENKEMVMKRYEETIRRKNKKSDFYNGIYDRYEYPVLTRDHIPPFWKFDMNPETNPYFMERLGVNCFILWREWKEMTENPSSQWQRVTAALTASASGIIRYCLTTYVPRRQTSTTCA